MTAEGWHRDPFRVHELRWFSGGVPTGLVRDADVESHDIPPAPTWDEPVEPAFPQSADGEDLRRADDGRGERHAPPVDNRSFLGRWADRAAGFDASLPFT